jgi:NAD-dependent SIR2 family protein deacetylase
VIAQLAADIRNRKVILFVGSGASNNLGLPTWEGLISHLASQLGYDKEIFQTLSANPLSLAEYYLLEKGGIDGLRGWMEQNWSVSDEALQASEVHRLIAKLGFDKIYTTNFDQLLERALELHGRQVHKVINVGDMSDAKPGATTVVKFHGDFSSGSSIVLGETQYFDRLSFQSPLDIKLRADALGKSLLFIGYSISDINIRLMLYMLTVMWRSSGQDSLRPKSYVFMPRPNAVQERILRSWNVTPVVGDSPTDIEALQGFLFELSKA